MSEDNTSTIIAALERVLERVLDRELGRITAHLETVSKDVREAAVQRGADSALLEGLAARVTKLEAQVETERSERVKLGLRLAGFMGKALGLGTAGGGAAVAAFKIFGG